MLSSHSAFAYTCLALGCDREQVNRLFEAVCSYSHIPYVFRLRFVWRNERHSFCLSLRSSLVMLTSCCLRNSDLARRTGGMIEADCVRSKVVI